MTTRGGAPRARLHRPRARCSAAATTAGTTGTSRSPTATAGIPADGRGADLTPSPTTTSTRVADALDDDTACVILEPIDVRGAARRLPRRAAGSSARARGALLVFDEMWTGFRLALGGAQERFGVTADLACFSKAVANGMPLSVLTGRADVMRLLERGRLLLHDLRRRGAVAGGRAARPSRELRDAATCPAYLDRARRDAARRLQRHLRASSGIAWTRCVGLRLPHAGRRSTPTAGDPLRAEVVRAAGADPARRPLGRLPQPVASRTPTPTSTHLLARLPRGAAARSTRRVERRRRWRARLRGEPVEPVFRRTTQLQHRSRGRPVTRVTRACFSLAGRVAVVTGAAGLLGREHCRALAEAGADVVADRSRRRRRARDSPRELARARRTALGSRADITDADVARARCATRSCARFGRVDVLVNNAALNDKFEEPRRRRRAVALRELPARALAARRSTSTSPARSSRCQVLGARDGARAARGSIINIASTYGIVAPDQSLYRAARRHARRSGSRPAYPTTKGAVLALHALPRRLLGRARRARERALARAASRTARTRYFVEQLRARARRSAAWRSRDDYARRRSSSWPATPRAT